MASIQVRVVINYIKRLTPLQRRHELTDLLAEFPDDWLNDAIQIAQEIRWGRKLPTVA